MPGLYARAQVVIYPSSFAEPMGLAPLEAMCSARPVVVTRMGGLDEGVSKDCEVGYVVPDRDHHKLADRIAELLNSPERARKMGLKGRQHVLRHFDLESSYLDAMLAEYGSALHCTGRSRPRRVSDIVSVPVEARSVAIEVVSVVTDVAPVAPEAVSVLADGASVVADDRMPVGR
ncbi:glycosyltransferase [Streptacidiphilus sp. PAMC 29251]